MDPHCDCLSCRTSGDALTACCIAKAPHVQQFKQRTCQNLYAATSWKTLKQRVTVPAWNACVGVRDRAVLRSYLKLDRCSMFRIECWSKGTLAIAALMLAACTSIEPVS